MKKDKKSVKINKNPIFYIFLLILERLDKLLKRERDVIYFGQM